MLNPYLKFLAFACIALVFLLKGLLASIFTTYNNIDFASFNNSYLLLSEEKFHEDVNEIFENDPFYTNFTFSITYAPKSIVTKMFNDLEYTAENGKRYGKSPYIINFKKDFYTAEVKDYAKGKVHLVYINNNINRYIYFIEGTFNAFVSLKGKMLVDIKYQQISRNIHFNIKTFLVLDNPVYWELFKKARNSPKFGKRINRLIDANIKYIVRLGRATVQGIYRDSRNKFQF